MRLLAVGSLGLLLCSLVWPQATSQISGTVRDQSGLAIPGAEVKVTQGWHRERAGDRRGERGAGGDALYRRRASGR